MKEYLEIKRFGPIEHIVLDGIKPLTVFIGESGSGKSIIMKVMAIMRWIYKMVNIRSYLKDYSGVPKSPFRFNFPNYLKMDGLEGYLKTDTFFKYSRGTCEMEYRDGKFNLVKQRIPPDELNLEKISFISEKRNLIPDAMDHGLSINKKAFYLNEIWNDYMKAVGSISELEMPFTNVCFRTVKTRLGTKHIIKPLDGDDYSIEIKDASSGIQSSTPIALIMEYYSRHYDLVKSFNRSVFSYLTEFEDLSLFDSRISIASFPNKRVNLFIEEPELSLYPDNQIKLTDFLVDRAFHSKTGDYDITLTISTHSPYIVNYLNVLLLRSDRGIQGNQVAVYRVYEGELQDLILKNENGDVAIDARDLSDAMRGIHSVYLSLKQVRDNATNS